MRFEPQIDIIAQKLVPVASGEVGEHLHVSKEIQQNFEIRKVPIEKVRFAPRIDIIAQKLAPVASGEVGEHLHVSKEI